MKPNVIVICVDSLRADCVGPGKAMGLVKTPNIDRLAGESVAFDRCYAEALPTIQVRRCFFTGRRSFPFRQAVPDEGLQPAGPGWHPISHAEDTLAEVLQDAGYLTGLVSDTYHMFKPTMNFTRGFLSWRFIRGQENDPYRSGPYERIDMAAHCPEGEATPALHPTVAQYLLNMLDRGGEEDYLAAKVFRTAAQWLEDNRKNGPFFLWVDSFSPHELWDPPRQYADAYCPPKPGVKDIIYPQAYRGKTMTPDEIDRCKALYLGLVTFVDRWVGHLLETAERLGLLDNTIIMFTADHGTELMDKGRFGKGGDRLHPYNTRVPWFIRTPDGPRGRRCDAWVQNLDFTPTLMSLVGVEWEGMHGRDAWPVALGEVLPHGYAGRNGTGMERESQTRTETLALSETTRRVPPFREYVTTGWHGHVCVRDDDWAVHLEVTKDDYLETARVYDLKSDPEETTDVSAENEAVVKQAVDRVDDLTGPLPVTFEYYRQRATGRTMRTFAPMRFGDDIVE